MDKEVRGALKLKGRLNLPADKSISHRSAMFAALYEGTSKICNFSTAADPQSTLSCLQKLGVGIEKKDDVVSVQGVGRSGFTPPKEELDCGNSGTTMRLLSGIVGGAGIPCTLVGDESLSARTMKRIIDPLRKMDIDIDARRGDVAPLHIQRSKPLSPLVFELPIPSAQLKSCVLLAGLFGEGSTQVIETIPSRDHTERLLKLSVEHQQEKKIMYSDTNVEIPEQSYTIPNDFSSAAFWLVAGSIHQDAAIALKSVGLNPSRTGGLSLLKKMGAKISITNEDTEGAEPVGDIKVQSAELQAITIGKDIVPNCIDELPVLIVAMLFAEGSSIITGAEELRHKETDRLSAMAEILDEAGADFIEFTDGFEIHGNPHFVPNTGTYRSHHDHRIAMAAAILSIMGKGSSTIKDAECTSISYPSFWDDLQKLTN